MSMKELVKSSGVMIHMNVPLTAAMTKRIWVVSVAQVK